MSARRKRKGIGGRKKMGSSSGRGVRLAQLTTQEKKVLELVANAQTNKEIAAALRISPSTVKRHLENILRKLHLKNRVAAAVYAVRMVDEGKIAA